MPTWEKWREALAEGKTAGSIWKGIKQGAHLHNQHQMTDPDKVAVAAGNQYGSAWIYAFPEKVVVIFWDGDGNEARREEFATPGPVSKAS
jgi:hypothetical protein